jgi:hypothetical protein
MRIWKYPLNVEARQLVYMPGGARPISVGVQNEFPVVWAQVDPKAAVTPGEDFDAGGLEFIGTVTIRGWYVAHIFEEFAATPVDQRERFQLDREQLNHDLRQLEVVA